MEAAGLRRVAVIGGGISGLAAAHSLANRGDLEVLVLEAEGRLGGKVRSTEVGGLIVEAGADSFVVRKPWAVDLCRKLGLEGQVIIPDATGAAVWTPGGLVPFPGRSAFGIPAGVAELFRWPGLSPGGKLRALGDLFLPAGKTPADQSLAEMVRRRLGTDASGLLVEPLLAGLHAADPERLSVLATFPEMVAWERDHGSLIRAARRVRKKEDELGKGRKPLFATLWGGLDLLVETLADHIGRGRIRMDTPVSRISSTGAGYRVDLRGVRLDADAVVLATPAFESARLLTGVNAEAAEALSRIPYASTAVVILVYPERTADRLPPDATGFVVPAGTRAMTACTWYSRKWPSEAFGDRAVVRCFAGRAGSEEPLAMSDAELIAAVEREVREAVPIGSSPEASAVIRWNRSMPQYEVGHLDLLADLDAALRRTPGIRLTGSAYRGIGIADCIRQGRESAEGVLLHLDRQGHGDMTDGASGPQDGEREAISWKS